MKLFNKLKFIKNRNQAINGNFLIVSKKKKEKIEYSSEKSNIEKYGVIDPQGNLVYDYEFDNIFRIGKDFLCFTIYDNKKFQNKISILNLKNNEFILKDTYGSFLQTTWFSDHNLVLLEQEDGMAFLDLEENSKCKYHSIRCVLSERQYIVENDGKYGIGICCFDDKKQKSIFKEVMHCEHESIDAVFEIEEVSNDDWWNEYYNPIYAITNAGKTKFFKIGYNEIKQVSEEIDGYNRNGHHLITIQQGDKFGLINFDGKTILSCEYDCIEDFEICNTMTNFKKDRKVGCINEDGKIVWPCIFDEIGKFKEGKAKAKICGFKIEIGENGESKDLDRLLESAQNPEKAQAVRTRLDISKNNEK